MDEKCLVSLLALGAMLDDLCNGLEDRIVAHGMASYRKLLADLFSQ